MSPIEPKRPTDPTPRPPARAASPVKAAGTTPLVRDTFERTKVAGPTPRWSFQPDTVRGTYDARAERTPAYDFPVIIAQVPAMWERRVTGDMRADARKRSTSLRAKETYGQLFERVGKEFGVDPCALAAYCVFESYDAKRGSFNPAMREVGGRMLAAGIAATQAQDWRGQLIPGLTRRFPKGKEATASILRANPEYALRCLAAEMKARYKTSGDLAKAFPLVAYPAWGDPKHKRGNYGDVAQYVSRAHALYQAFVGAATKRGVDIATK